MNQDEFRESFGNLVRRGAFKPVARHITGPDPEERLQDSICQTFEMAARYAERGQALDDAILVHSCRQRALDLKRRFVKTDAQPARDALHRPNYTQGKVAVYRIDGLVNPETGEFIAQNEVEALVPGLATALQVNPQRDIISAVDLERFLNGLPEQDQALLEMRMAGSTLKESAEKLDLSISTVWARLKKLGLALSDRSGIAVASTNPSAA